MNKISEKQLILQLKELKNIKPREEWVSLLKSKILAETKTEFVAQKNTGKLIGILDIISASFFQKKMAYAMATLVFMIVGVLGFAQYTMPGDLLFPIKKIAEQSSASLTGQNVLTQSVLSFNNRVNDLAQISKEGRAGNIPSTIAEVNQNISELSKTLKNNPVKDPVVIKEIAATLKTLASVKGTDVNQSQEVKDLYETIVSSQIEDFKNTTLTTNQKDILEIAEKFYKEGKFSDALEQLLLINK